MRLMLPDDKIVCDKCREASTDFEDSARAEGWVIDHGADPRAHICPACQ